MTSTRRLCILVADDDPDALARLTGMAYRASPGARIVQAADGYAALRQAEHVHFDLAVLDYQMPGLTGTDVARILRTRGIRCEVVTSSPISAKVRAETTPKDDVPRLLPGWVGACCPPEKREASPSAEAAPTATVRGLYPRAGMPDLA